MSTKSDEKMSNKKLEDVVALVKPHVTPSVKRYLKRHVPEFYETTSGEDATEKAAFYADSKNYRAVISVGGDGLFNRIYTGVYESSNQHMPIGLFRGNSGNGAHGTLHIPYIKSHQLRIIEDALEYGKYGQIKKTDIMEIRTWDEDGNEVKHYGQLFGAGLTGEVIYHRSNINDIIDDISLPGKLKHSEIEEELRRYFRSRIFQYPKYAIATLLSLANNRRFKAYINNEDEPDIYADGFVEISAGNRVTPGNGVKLLPEADPYSGRIDVLLTNTDRFNLLRQSRRVMKGLKKIDEFYRYKSSEMSIIFTEEAPYMHFDGERMNNKNIRKVNLNTLPGAISVITPKKKHQDRD